MALSCLEKLAHSSGTSLYAGDFSVTVFEVPDRLKITEITIAQLSEKSPAWQKVINYPITQNMGSKWLQSHDSAVLKVPSAIIELEYNYLFNPAHADYEKIKIISVNKFSFDTRLKGNRGDSF